MEEDGLSASLSRTKYSPKVQRSFKERIILGGKRSFHVLRTIGVETAKRVIYEKRQEEKDRDGVIGATERCRVAVATGNANK